ncbi:hypothetical protein KLA_17037 [Cellulophaga geojensis KL-A]|uniref:Uncharacterized protein n=1 Tax=Cellulophaga geojensis KL-A TaxID=1328323 RepID=A0ABN0RJI4_9FLAO|nr:MULTISPECIES: hypothetical protein [Cellulophaga]APU08792.1 hypothetical protein A5M85_00350 [Cellulophaga lytica]EWH10008.1 hypothetical protein KLA_17037 [Cellulophaga geojensis KL-A]
MRLNLNISKIKLKIIVFFVMPFFAFSNSGLFTSEKANDKVDNSELNTDGLYFAEFYDYIYRGHFENIKIKRLDYEFLMIYEQYLRTFGVKCSKYLLVNKVEIMEIVCDQEEIGYNAYGDVISRVCVKYKWQGTGLYAKPDIYNAKMKIVEMHKANGIDIFLKMVTDPNAMGNSIDMLHKRKGLANDMEKFFILNQCNSKAIIQFEENLKRFALNKTPIRLKKKSKYTIAKNSGGPKGQQNYNKLVDDLVADQAKTWAFNRYTKGSISGLRIESKNSEGKPISLRANYKFRGFSNNGKGWVKIIFKNGVPDCMYFFDFPSNCKKPNSGIVTSYSLEKYSNQ